MIKMNEDFNYCIQKFGPPAEGEAVSSDVLAAYASKVPSTMVDFWHEYGVGLWLDGRFQLVRPDRYQGLIDMLLHGDPDYPPQQSVLIGYGAFGELLIWNNSKYSLRVTLVEKESYTTFPNAHYNRTTPDIKLPLELSHADDVIYDHREHTKAANPLFDRAMKKCGKLAYGECYGFVPAMGLGGRGVLEEVQRVRALEHFSIIAQLAPIQLRYMDTEKRKIVVLRELGG